MYAFHLPKQEINEFFEAGVSGFQQQYCDILLFYRELFGCIRSRRFRRGSERR